MKSSRGNNKAVSSGKVANDGKPREKAHHNEPKSQLTPKSILKNWEDSLRIKLGKTFKHASQIFLTGKLPVIRAPKQYSAASMRQAVTDEETERQMKAGTARENVVIPFQHPHMMRS
jgi:hypothetical protein